MAWVYDAASNLTSASDTYSAYAYTYNSDNLATQVDNSGTPTGPHVVLNIGYDNMRRETSLSATVASTLDFLNNYAFDADSQITQITQQGQTGGNSVAAKLVNFSFDNDGRTTAISRYANLAATQLVDTSTLAYNADSALTSLSEDKGGTNFASYTWSYDHMERLTADTVGTASDSYAYNLDSELTAATHSGGGNESYSYDSTGNRTNTGYSTGTNNQLSSDGTYNYLYDANGNMIKKTAISGGAYVTYTWDYHNRLTDVKAYNSSNVLQSHEHYVYDVFNRLIERQVDPTGGGTYTTVQNFAYSGNNVVLVYNGSGTLTDRFFVTSLSPGGRGAGGEGAERALADENGSGVVSWFLKDREGSTDYVVQYNSGTDTTAVVNQIIYSSYGAITSQTNSTYQPLFAYTGQMWDAAAALYYYHARCYDPATGRFISQDPLSFAAKDANLYRYVANSPTNLVDPRGTDAIGPASMAQMQAEVGYAQPETAQTQVPPQQTTFNPRGRVVEGEDGKIKIILKKTDPEFPGDPAGGSEIEIVIDLGKIELSLKGKVKRREDAPGLEGEISASIGAVLGKIQNQRLRDILESRARYLLRQYLLKRARLQKEHEDNLGLQEILRQGYDPNFPKSWQDAMEAAMDGRVIA